MIQTGRTPSQLLNYLYSKVGPHYYERIDLYFTADLRDKIIENVSKSNPGAIAGVKVARTDNTDGFRYRLEDNSWLLIRFSGTEPLLRIYSEASSPEQVQKILQAGKQLTGIQY
jgi:phosphomannomutase